MICVVNVTCHPQWWVQDFPEEGAPTLRGAPTYDFAKISQKLHEIERIGPPLDPPLTLSEVLKKSDCFIMAVCENFFIAL